MEIYVLKGYTYVATANTDSSITDENGLNLVVKGGSQGMFIATADKVEVTGECTVTQTRNFKGALSLTAAGGGGETLQPGEVVIGGTQGSMTIQDVNTASRLYPGTFGTLTELPEGVTLAALESALAPQVVKNAQLPLIFQSIVSAGGASSAGAVSMVTLFGGTPLTRFPSTVNFASLSDGTYMFGSSPGLETFDCDLPVLTRGVNMFTSCNQLTSFKSNAPMMTATTNMFSGCSKLAHWDGTFGQLTSASNMFNGCVLDLESVQNLANALPRISGGGMTIGVDSTKVSQEQQDAANAIIVDKGWTVTWQRN